jgi:cyclopropane fatty-acyl-phospholipid synthase-like methyltransferase
VSTHYEKEIISYYETTEASYVDGWDLNNSFAMHYGYKDASTKTFGDTLLKMNQVLADAAKIKSTDIVLDAGCGIGGSSFYLAKNIGCKCIGITLSEKQVAKANNLASKKGLNHLVQIKAMPYLHTTFPDASFDVVWGLESICYAEDKEQFVQEAYRLLKSGGRLIIADGMVTTFANNEHSIIKKWLKGWRVNYLESPERFTNFYTKAGFKNIQYTDITKQTKASSKRLLWIYYGSKLWGWWKKITFRYKWTTLQEDNIDACLYQYKGMQLGLWGYGMLVGEK